MTRLTRSDLISWADTREAQGQLPELIRRLIVASNRNVDSLVMPYGDSIGRSGLDGFTRASVASAYVAQGEAVWEFGTNKKNVAKANEDFAKRTKGTADSRQKELTFHFVTPRHWESKADWISDPGPSEDKISSQWKEIRVYDVDDLLGWLSDCPSVEAWFSRKIGKATAGLRDIDTYWENVATFDTGVLKTKTLLAGREDFATTVQAHFSNFKERPRPLALSSRSPAEVAPFAAASILDGRCESAIACTLVVDSRPRWEQLIVEQAGLGLIVSPQVQPTREELQQAVRQNHRVLYCSSDNEVRLSRLAEFEVRQALVSSGIGEAEATQHAKQCGGDGQLLLDRLSGLSTPAGKMGSSLDDRVKIACLLLGAWNGEHPADREIFAHLAGIQYSEIESSLASDSIDPNGLLFRADGKYRLLSPELAWLRYGRLLTKSAVDAFAFVVQYILTDDDPTAGMPGEERFTAQFLGKRPAFSGTLRKNVVHSLAIAGSLGATRLNLGVSMNASFVDWIVRSSLEKATFERWASFGAELSILAEAAPEALLDAFERDATDSGPLAEIMRKSETGFFGSSPHTGILWALERLCWSPEYLERSIRVLLRLAAINPDIKSGNNPINSIQETLQVHCPQTNADWTSRQQAILRMIKDDAKTAFRVVLSLFPRGYATWMTREKPAWRNWGYGYKGGVTYGQIAIEVRWCVDQLLTFTAHDAGRWCELIGLCGHIEYKQFDTILNELELQLASGVFDDSGKRQIWETLNAQLVQWEWSTNLRRLNTREIVDSAEVNVGETDCEPHFPSEIECEKQHSTRLKYLLDKSTPNDIVVAGCYAFLCGIGDNHCSRHFTDRFNYEKRQSRIGEARRNIVENVYQREGLKGLQRLAAIEHVDANGVGFSAAVSSIADSLDVNELMSMLASPVASDRLIAMGFFTAWARKHSNNLPDLVSPILASISDEAVKATFLQSLPPCQETWDCIDSQSSTVQYLYWRRAPLPWEFPETRVAYLIQNIVRANRADRAIDLLAHRRKVITEDTADLVFEALEALPHTSRESDEVGSNNLRWEIQQLFEVLYVFRITEVRRLVRLELCYHTVFDRDTDLLFQPRGLLVAIRDSPSLFVEMLSYAWKDDSGNSAMPSDDATQAIKWNVQSLLHKLAELPGQSDLCPMISSTTIEWFSEVLRIARKCQYLTAVGLQVPDIITCGSWRDIASWPKPEMVEVINALSELDPENSRRRLSLSLSNARGMHWVDPTGKSEKDQATQIRNRANQLRDACPAASWALFEIAASLDTEAARNIDRADWER